jgi:hypothetical protein
VIIRRVTCRGAIFVETLQTLRPGAGRTVKAIPPEGAVADSREALEGLIAEFGAAGADYPAIPARGAMFSARHRAGRDGQALTAPPVVAEHAYYDLAETAEPKGPDHAPTG